MSVRFTPTPRRVLALVAALLVVSAGLAGVRAWYESRHDALVGALALAPNAARYSWTDWSAVRQQVGSGSSDLSASSTRTQVDEFLDRAYDADLTSASTLEDAAGMLQQGFGFSPATIEWELFSQSEDGAVVLAQLPDSISTDDVADHLEQLGFTAPAAGQDVWTGTEDLLAGIDPKSTTMPILTQVALDPEHGLVITGDEPGYVQQTLDRLGDADRPDGFDSVQTAAATLTDPLAAVVTSGDYACGEFSLGQADSTDQATADQLIGEAGKINPYLGFAMGVLPEGTPPEVEVAMAFDSDDAARANAASRSKLAAGPAPGQGGAFSDRFGLGEVAAHDDVVTMRLQPHEDEQVFGDLSTGTVLFASC